MSSWENSKQNESFNGMIRERFPKTTYVGFETFKLTVYDALGHSNLGSLSSLEVFKSLKMPDDLDTHQRCGELDNKRDNIAKYKDRECVKKARKILRGKKKKKDDKAK